MYDCLVYNIIATWTTLYVWSVFTRGFKLGSDLAVDEHDVDQWTFSAVSRDLHNTGIKVVV